MILGVVSDSHGNLPLLYAVAADLRQRFNADLIVHLGDDFADAKDLAGAGYAVRAVPGLWCPEYAGHRAPHVFVETFEGIEVAAAHHEKDIRGAARGAGIILVGHTHTPRLELVDGTLYVNPGHLKAPVNRGQRASFAVLELSPEEVRGALYDAVTGQVCQELAVPRGRLA